MPTHSTIIDHPDSARIQYDLARGAPIRALARKYGVDKHVLYRFRKTMPPQLRAAHLAERLKRGADLDKLRIEESEGILQNLALQRARLLLVQDAALEAGDRREVAYIADVVHRNIRTTGVYLGEFAQHQVQTSINILISSEYLELRTDLLRALAPFPDARRAVAAALHAREARMADEAKAAPPAIEGVAQEAAVDA